MENQSQLHLVSMSEVKTEKSRKDNKISRQYYTAYFMDPANPFAKQAQTNIWQDHNSDGTVALWKSGDPAIVKKFVGKTVPGAIVNSEVEPYEIDGRQVETFTCVVLGHQTKAQAFKLAGHPLKSDDKIVVEEIKETSAALND